MVRKICIDTDVLIDILQGNERAKQVQEFSSLPACTTTVSVFELNSRESRLEKVRHYLHDFTILPFDAEAAREASQIRKTLRDQGNPVGMRDVFIAAITRVNECKLLTFNQQHYEHIPGVELVDLDRAE